ncbi:hypothetical protein Vretimale_19768 [Volvox reticuliferus]|uniref:Uncharacterized protein n=1 Tax=Volvox reticuliferus TaxID=1737510 RepID=A0A8J4GZL4_9CHLO|nr:hypothetical protein Vretimale_19768 [Volvox reticuliferus]
MLIASEPVDCRGGTGGRGGLATSIGLAGRFSREGSKGCLFGTDFGGGDLFTGLGEARCLGEATDLGGDGGFRTGEGFRVGFEMGFGSGFGAGEATDLGGAASLGG